MYKEMETVSLDKLEAIKFPVIMVPFFGAIEPFMVRELTQAQIRSCGDFTLIESFEDKIYKKDRKIKLREMVAYADRSHNICRAAMVKPTYDEVFNMLSTDVRAADARKQIEELKSLIATAPRGPKLSRLEEEFDNLRIWSDYLFPNDFTSYLTTYALGIAKSDIKSVSEAMLLEAAILAQKGHDNPADHIDGKFTPFMRDDINKRAWILLADEQKARK